MTKKVVIIGNWKMNKNPIEAKKFMTEFKKLYESNKNKISSNMRFGIAAPAIDLIELKNSKIHSSFIIAAQNMHFASSGAFTGELSSEMIKSVGANSILIGHSERREMFNEKDEDVNKKILVALKNNLIPIVCVGETLEEFELKKTKIVVKKQLEIALKGLSISEIEKLIIAYEPIWAIGTGKTATSLQAEVVCKYIKTLTSEKTIIQYGGSVKPENISELLDQPSIDGALVGGASLDAKSFIKLLTLNK